jgi:hypothetical protein
MNRKTVAIVVPLSRQDSFSESEKISLTHLKHFLGGYDRFFVTPPGFSEWLAAGGEAVEEFDGSYFGSVAANKGLMLSAHFYERFRAYEFILIYHLDSLVFKDELMSWCSAGYDYIGPPWIAGPDLPWLKSEGVGNGGFSLRNVDACLRVLTAPGLRRPRRPKSVGDLPRWIWRQVRPARREGLSLQQCISSGIFEDRFWGRHAFRFDRGFRVAPVAEALRFAFEAHPATCFERNGRQLPFGCHAWERYDRKFWEPFLLGRQQLKAGSPGNSERRRSMDGSGARAKAEPL